MKDFNKLCTPAKIYFAIAVIATLFDLFNGASIMFAFWKLIFAFIWTFILGGLCNKGYKSISWFLVLLPYILMFLATLDIYHVSEGQRQFMRSIGLQGAYGQEAFVNSPSQQAQQMALQQVQQMAAQQQAQQAKMLVNEAMLAKLPDQATAADKRELEVLKNGIVKAKQDYDNSTGRRRQTREILFNILKQKKDKLDKLIKKYNI
jgi:hypothetical protein